MRVGVEQVQHPACEIYYRKPLLYAQILKFCKTVLLISSEDRESRLSRSLIEGIPSKQIPVATHSGTVRSEYIKS
jgi:hypothetical protein